ncbi:hypothetical protein [Methylobrevis albus]|uniref:Uncharacterized protein n=1 Tax=Methylobrevis albus TaxID=2793297 RepID=A0A931I1Y7_9HYPH|nr:hypothetical protein [Methylobrevis albus]MBH0238332.1 hypothetical protein [Methylobrevis albus]
MTKFATTATVALFALGLSAGFASAECMGKMTMASTATQQPAPAPLPVDVATLETGSVSTAR